MKNKIFVIFLVLIGLVGIKALFHSGFYTSHDGRHQIIRLMHFHQGLVDGQLPVRWAGTALSGYGYPLFIFTYRLPFWIAEGWYLISKNLGDAIKFAFIITFIASGLTMYWFLTKLWSSKLAGFMGAILYLWAPYRFVNIFVRAALGEAVGFVFLPLIFLGLLNLTRQKKRQFFWIVTTAFSLAGLILSHAMVFGLWLIPLGLWGGLNLYQSKDKRNYLFSLILSGILSLFLTAYYWLPAMVERKYVKFAGILGDYYKTHFVTLKQLLYSRWGYGFSMPGVIDDMMSFQVGIAQWVVVVFSLFLSLLWLKKRAEVDTNLCSVFESRSNKKNLSIKLSARRCKHKNAHKNCISPRIFMLFLFWQVVFSISIYLMLPYSSWFYQFIKKIFVIDLPWRFLSIAVFSASVLFAGLISIIRNNLLKWSFAFLVLFLVFYGNRNHLKVNQYVYLNDSEYWQSTETSNEYEDYIPRWFSNEEFEQTDPQLITLKGISNNKLLKRKSNFFQFISEVNSEKAEVASKLAYYPGWQIFIDGQKQNISHENGRIKVVLDKGNHLITLVFRETNLRNFCNWLSVVTLIAFILIFFRLCLLHFIRNQARN